jgi:hypothetical protein
MDRPTTISGLAVLCTEVYQLTGPCNGIDAVRELKVTGWPVQTDWRMKVWETKPIMIRGIEVAQAGGGTIEWAMAGNNRSPDIMLLLAKGMNYARAVFPAGTGMPMPAKAKATEDDYLDFHIVCKGEPFTVWFKIEYTVQTQD